MSVGTDALAERSLEILQELDDDFAVVCDMASMGGGFPKCPAGVAEWVAWRGNCCAESPKYYLLCVFCKDTYLRWMAKMAHLTCDWCLEPVDFVSFTPLKA